MSVKIKTASFFNPGTQQALLEKSGGYVNKEFHMREHAEQLKKKYNLDKVYRLDLGQNCDGCAPALIGRIEELMAGANAGDYLKNYPQYVCRELRRKISDLHDVDPSWILLSAGLDQMLSIIAATFFQQNDRVLMNSPSFYLFREYSQRMGAIPAYLELKEKNGFRWTNETFDEYLRALRRLQPKLVWIASPNNPTGDAMSITLLKSIVAKAAREFSFVVVDEAYGEFTDNKEKPNSASALLPYYDNLMVLRTFSKAYGLANIRVGYAMCANRDILNGLKVHSTYFPITQFSFDIACAAMDNMDYLEQVRKVTKERYTDFTKQLDELPQIKYIPSETNILMMKHKNLSADLLIHHLEEKGIITANVPGNNPAAGKYVRVTVDVQEANNYLANALKTLRHPSRRPQPDQKESETRNRQNAIKKRRWN